MLVALLSVGLLSLLALLCCEHVGIVGRGVEDGGVERLDFLVAGAAVGVQEAVDGGVGVGSGRLVGLVGVELVEAFHAVAQAHGEHAAVGPGDGQTRQQLLIARRTVALQVEQQRQRAIGVLRHGLLKPRRLDGSFGLRHQAHYVVDE